MQVNFNPAKIKLVVGLGNPGKKYENTYHNAGRLFINHLKKQLPITNYQLLITDVFMNQSGEFIKKLLKKHRLKPQEVLIIHDDADIELGRYKFSFNRRAAGHKGVESVIRTLGTKDFWRLRIGIRPIRPISSRPKAAAFVLKKISAKDRKILQEVFKSAQDHFY